MTDIVQNVQVKPPAPHLIKKGQVLNPKGRGKGNLSMSTLLKNALHKMSTGESMTPAEKITMSLLRQSETGNLKAIEMVMDRTEGKPVQAIINRNLNTVEALPQEKIDSLKSLLGI
jgi:hypothetical protein